VDWNQILNWKLLAGSHEFPGPDGGTCINEAAVIAAGFKYRKIDSSDDCPACFSRLIATYTILLNDAMSDELRQELLMPFVTRLAGTRDSDEVEIQRAVYIAIQTTKQILSHCLRFIGLENQARQCEQAEDLALACAVAHANDDDATHTARSAVFAALRAARAARKMGSCAADVAEFAVARAAAAVLDAAYATDQEREVFTLATQILDGALTLGKKPQPIETSLAIARMEAIKLWGLNWIE
jgi:hypothetical protein